MITHTIPTVCIDIEGTGTTFNTDSSDPNTKSHRPKVKSQISLHRTPTHFPLTSNCRPITKTVPHQNYDLPTKLIRNKSIALNNRSVKAYTPFVDKSQLDYFTSSESESNGSTPGLSLGGLNDYFSVKFSNGSRSNVGERLPSNSLGAQPISYLTTPPPQNMANYLTSRLVKSKSFSYSQPTSLNLIRPSQNFSKLIRARSKLLFDSSSNDDNSETMSLISEADTFIDNVTEFCSVTKANYQSCIPINSTTDDYQLDYNNLTLLDYALLPLTYLPSVFLGLVLNFLNAVSYGMIVFPTQLPTFASFGPDGVSIFLVSTFISQFVFSVGGSGFACAFGGFMLETVPFLHLICQSIIQDLGENNQHGIVATTMVAYCLTSIITGCALFIMGYFKLGNLVGFFPRHILVGCIGGVGYFLIKTALETVTKIKLNYFELACWYKFFAPESVALWGTSLVLALVLKFLLRRQNSPILMPLFYLTIPIVFFSITYMLGLDLEYLRSKGWLFASPETSKPFYSFYSNFDFSSVSWSTIYKLLPTMFALTFFGILSVPINVPAVAVSTKVDHYDLNRELKGHGWSNLISGLCGSLPNYVVYSSSMLFYKSGGDNHLAGILLAISTAILWTFGTGIVSYVPCIVVGSLILHLGTELFNEGVIQTYGSMSTLEYATIVVIVTVMGLFGFVEGVLVGIVLACLFFVYTYSGMKPIRNSFSGKAATSSVRRNLDQRKYLDKASNFIHVLKLQGFMFFGTIDQVETTIRNMLDNERFNQNPIKFLVLDFTLVTGVDFSAVEAFIRSRRLLQQRGVDMVVCGIDYSSQTGDSLYAIGIWDNHDGDGAVDSCPFDTLNSALEWCENSLLEKSDLFDNNPEPTLRTISNLPVTTNSTLQNQQLGAPNTSNYDISDMHNQSIISQPQQPITLLLHIFNNTHPNITPVLYKILTHFEPVTFQPGEIVCNQGDLSDSIYLVESGTLKASVNTKVDYLNTQVLVESILPGTMLGELSLITSRSRMYTVTAEEHCKLWKLSKPKFEQFEKTNPVETIIFIKAALAYSSQAMAILAAHAFELN